MKIRKAMELLLFVALLVLTGCPSLSNNPDTETDDGTTMVAVLTVISDLDQLGADGSQDAPVEEEIVVSSLVSDGPEIIVGDAPTLLIADDSAGKTVFLGYAASNSAEEAPQVALNIESTLLSLVLIKLGGIPGDMKDEILDLVKKDSRYNAALQELTAAYRITPYILDEIMNHQTLVDRISELAQGALDAYIASIEEKETANYDSGSMFRALESETKSFRYFLSPWKDGSPWTWYYEQEGVSSLNDPPFFAQSSEGQFAIGSKGYINYGARFYNESGEEYYAAMTNRNISLINYAMNSQAARTSLTQSMFQPGTSHVHFGRLGEEPFAMVLNFVNVIGAVMNVVADGKGFAYISDTLAASAGELTAHATVYQKIASLAPRLSQINDVSGFFGQFSLETLRTIMTDYAMPLMGLVVNANSAKNAALHAIWIKGSAKLAAKISSPAGWAIMIFDGVNSLVPTVSSMITSPLQAGYDLVWMNDKVVQVTRNDSRPDLSTNVNTGAIAQTGHIAVWSLSYSPDGSTLASSGFDSTIKLWKVSNGTLLRTLSEHTGFGVTSVDFSPDGTVLASGGIDGTLKLWRVSNGQVIRSQFMYQLEGSNLPVSAVAFAPDGNTLASGGGIGTVILWNVSDGTKLHTLSGNYFSSSVAFSPDGQTLAHGSGDYTVKLWNVSSGTLIRSLRGHNSWIYSVSFDSDGGMLVSGSGDGTVKLWNASDGTLIRTLSGHSAGVKSVVFSPNGDILASGSEDNTIKLWNKSDGTLLRTLEGHNSSVLSIAFSPNGKTLASGGGDNTIKLWKMD